MSRSRRQIAMADDRRAGHDFTADELRRAAERAARRSEREPAPFALRGPVSADEYHEMLLARMSLAWERPKTADDAVRLVRTQHRHYDRLLAAYPDAIEAMPRAERLRELAEILPQLDHGPIEVVRRALLAMAEAVAPWNWRE